MSASALSDTGGIPALELRRVTRDFHVSAGLFAGKRRLRAVNDVSLSIETGEVVGLVGESGCGKSTLSKVLLGLLPASAGEVLFHGEQMSHQKRRAVAKRIQPIFQDPYSSLNPRRSIGSIIAQPLHVHGFGNRTEIRRRVSDMLDVVGLPSRLAQASPAQLSGGQRQRVAIARALILRPEILICDEPTSALDVSVQSQILNLLLDLRREFQLTYLFISHNLAVVEHIATRVAVMYLGRLVEVAETRAFFQAPRHPYSQALLDSIITPNPAEGIPTVHLGGSFPNPIDPPSGCAFHPRCPHAMPRCATDAPRLLTDKAGEIACHLTDMQQGA